MRQWIPVNSSEVNVPRRESKNGVEVQVLVSPYDVPVAVRGSYDHVTKECLIDFRYATEDEEWVSKKTSEHITLYMGAKSRRLHRIVMDENLMRDVEGVGLVVLGLPDRLPEITQHPSRRGNFETAVRVLTAKKDELFAGAGS